METVKVRIAVVVADDGYWIATGWRNAEEEDMETSVDSVDRDHVARYWVTAELPIPVVTEVSGVVEKA